MSRRDRIAEYCMLTKCDCESEPPTSCSFVSLACMWCTVMWDDDEMMAPTNQTLITFFSIVELVFCFGVMCVQFGDLTVILRNYVILLSSHPLVSSPGLSASLPTRLLPMLFVCRMSRTNKSPSTAFHVFCVCHEVRPCIIFSYFFFSEKNKQKIQRRKSVSGQRKETETERSHRAVTIMDAVSLTLSHSFSPSAKKKGKKKRTKRNV